MYIALPFYDARLYIALPFYEYIAWDVLAAAAQGLGRPGGVGDFSTNFSCVVRPVSCVGTVARTECRTVSAASLHAS